MQKEAIRLSILQLPININNIDEWDTIGLPDNLCDVNPIHSSSKVIKTFLKNLQKKHDNYVQTIGRQLLEINTDIEYVLRQKCKALKKDLKYLIENVRRYICYNLDSYEVEILNFGDYKFEKCKQYSSNLFTHGKNKILDFYTFLNSIEKCRTDKFKKALKHSYSELQKINSKSPYEVQLFFEEQILGINQIVLTNLRNYKEIETHLLLVFTNEIKLALYKISKIEEYWKILCKNEMIKRLKEYGLSEEDIINVLFKDQSIKKIIKLFNEKIEDLLEQMQLSSFVEIKPKSWLDNTKNALDDLDCTAKQLINNYKTAAEYLYNKFYIESETVLEKLFTLKIASITEINEIHENISEPVFIKIKESMSFDLSVLQNSWKETIELILESLYAKYNFLEELENIFISHDIRVNEVKLLVEKDYKQLMIKNTKTLQGKEEASLNIVLDEMRKESSRNNLDNSLKNAIKILNKIKSSIEKHKEDELRLVSKLYEYIDIEINILKEQLKHFVLTYSTEEIVAANEELNKGDAKSLFEILKQSRGILKELVVWKTKILLNIETLIETCEQDQQNKTTHWVTEQEETIILNCESKLDFHKLRYDRIQKDIYNLRLAEINSHAERFDSHNSQVDTHLKKLIADQNEFQIEQQKIINILSDNIESVDVDGLNKSKEIDEYFLNSNDAFRKNTNDFTERVNQFIENVNTQVNTLYSSNTLFLKSIKLFHEGGNFSSQESKIYSKKISNLTTLIKKSSGGVILKVKHFESKIILATNISLAKFEERSIYIKQYINFNEDVVKRLELVQAAIKNVVIETKTAKSKIDLINERLVKLTQLRCNPYPYLNYVIGDCTELIKLSLKYKEYLEDFLNAPKLRPFPVKRVSTPLLPRKSAVSLSQISRITIKNENLKLFDQEKEICIDGEVKFLSQIRDILMNNEQKFEQKAKKFYATARKEDCITFNVPNNFRNFMTGILQKFTYYYLQCLQIWVNEIRDIVCLLHDLRKLLLSFCEKYLELIHKRQSEIFIAKCNAYLKDIDNNIKAGFMNINNISDQLKPLYGYPGNHTMLDDLIEQINVAFKMVEDNFDISIEPPKKYLEIALDEYVTKITEEKEKIEVLYSMILERNIFDTLVTQVKDVMFSTNFDNYPMPPEYTKIIDNSQNDISNMNDMLLIPEAPKSAPSELVVNCVQVFEEILVEKLDKICEIECDFRNKIPEMKRVWEENVEKVIELYNVKY